MTKEGVATEDLDAIVSWALRGARLGTEKRSICRVVREKGLRGSAPELIRMLKDQNGDVRATLRHVACHSSFVKSSPTMP